MKSKAEWIEVRLRHGREVYGTRQLITYITQDERRKEINYIRLRLRHALELADEATKKGGKG